jgi:PEP-CTERM motif-containing protein
MRTTAMKILLTCVAAGLAWAGDARAGSTLAIEIFEGSNTPYMVSASTGPGGFLNIDTSSTLLADAAPDFTFNSFGVTSSESSTQATIHGVGSINTTATGAVTLTVLVSQTGYTMPPGPGYSMASSSSYTASPGNSDTLAFQSFASSTQTLFAKDIPSPGVTYNPVGFSGSNDESPNTPFTASAGYTLTEQFVWTTSGDGSSIGALLQPTGSTIVTAAAVPEPSSLVLLSVASIGLVAIGRRRCATRSRRGQSLQS